MEPDHGLVDLGGTLVPEGRLSLAGVGIGDASLRQAVDLLQTEPFGEPVPAAGWRVLDEQQGGSMVIVGAYDPGCPGWTTVTFRREGSGWRPHRSSHGQQPRPAPRAVAMGLQLEFAQPVVTIRRGKRPSIQVLLTNTTPRIWQGLSGNGWVLGRLFDLSDAHYLEDDSYAVTLAGHALELLPGGTQELDVLLLTRGVWYLPVGDYGIEATIARLSLQVNNGVLRIIDR